MDRLHCCLFIAVFLSMTFTHAQTASATDQVYRGTVVDAETGEPLDGAVVVVLWFKKPWLAMDGGYFHRVSEAVADGGGRFSIDASPGIDSNPFTFVLKDPEFIIFKPWYHPLTPSYAIRLGLGPDIYETLRQGAVVRLPRLKTREELVKFAALSALGIGGDVPRKKISNLVRLVNSLRKSLFLEPYPEP